MRERVREGGFSISDVPVVAATAVRGDADAEAAQLPLQGQALLLAIPRNPRTLFVCWTVDWPAAFGSDVPVDHKAHVKLRSDETEQTHAVEPLSGSCAINDLEPGKRYAVELGFYGCDGSWRVIALANEIKMPPLFPSADKEPEVAVIPFHLTFQRLLDAWAETARSDIAKLLAAFEERAAQGIGEEREVLRALGFTGEELKGIAKRKAELTRIKPKPQQRTDFRRGGSSPPSWSSS